MPGLLLHLPVDLQQPQNAQELRENGQFDLRSERQPDELRDENPHFYGMICRFITIDKHVKLSTS